MSPEPAPPGAGAAATAVRRVAVIGGGVGGLTAAHELSERGFAVTVFEARCAPPDLRSGLGGKARSWVTSPEELEHAGLKPDHPPIPAEHGFRFFPGFYRNVIDTMTRIPGAGGDGRSVAAHLVSLSECVLATSEGGAPGPRLVSPLPTGDGTLPSWSAHLRAWYAFRGAMPGAWECLCLLGALARLATSCETRMEQQLEFQSWLQYVNPASGPRRSAKFLRLFAVGLTRSFVATRAEEMSARTAGQILLQLLYDMFGATGRPSDRVLDGPTSAVWITPWVEQLTARGVRFEPGREAAAIDLVRPDGRPRVAGVRFRRTDDPAREIESHREFDHYVLAIPCERVQDLLVDSPELAAASPTLLGVYDLRTEWMSGMVIPHDGRGPGLPRAHILCLDSPWALTLLDERQVWAPEHITDARAMLSVDISDWESPGATAVPGRFMAPPRIHLLHEVWKQLRAHLGELPEAAPEAFSLDDGIQSFGSSYGVVGPSPPPAGARDPRPAPRPDPDPDPQAPLPPGMELRTSEEPLFINTPGSWTSRPPAAVPEIANLVLAADYVRTSTNFASMEGANEAARQAVNAILDREGSTTPRCRVYPLADPPQPWFAGVQTRSRRADAVCFRLGLRAPFRLPILAWTVAYAVRRRRSGRSPRSAG